MDIKVKSHSERMKAVWAGYCELPALKEKLESVTEALSIERKANQDLESKLKDYASSQSSKRLKEINEKLDQYTAMELALEERNKLINNLISELKREKNSETRKALIAENAKLDKENAALALKNKAITEKIIELEKENKSLEAAKKYLQQSESRLKADFVELDNKYWNLRKEVEDKEKNSWRYRIKRWWLYD